LLCPMIGIRC